VFAATSRASMDEAITYYPNQGVHAEEWDIGHLAASEKLVCHHVLQRANIILRHAPILTLTPFSLFIVDSQAQPLKAPLPPANLIFQIKVNIPLN
jgi:hypothetical protein